MPKGIRGRVLCSEQGCDRVVLSRGMCSMHYQRWVRSGGQPQRRMGRTDRFWAKVDKNGPLPEHRPDLGPCWLWLGAFNDYGYGSFTVVVGRTAKAHRWAYEHQVGPIPHGLTIDHLCRVRHCVNPSHLEPVTRGRNVLRGETLPADNREKTQCPHGHDYTPDNTYLYGNRRACRTCRRERDRERKAAQRGHTKRR